MKVKDSFILKNILSQYVVVATGDDSVSFYGMLRLNEEAAFAFEMLKEDTTEEQLVAALLEKYPADEEETKASVAEFISILKEVGAIEAETIGIKAIEVNTLEDPVHLSDYDSLIRKVLSSGGEFRLYPRGTSMLPLIRQGRDSVVLRALNRPAKAKDILFYQRRDGSYVLHRVKKITPEGMTLWGDNQIVLEHGVTDDQVIGYVARIFRDDKEVNCCDFRYRAYLWLWCFMTIRKSILRIKQHFRKGG